MENGGEGSFEQTKNMIRNLYGTAHIEPAADILHDAFIDYAIQHRGEMKQFWTQMEPALGKDMLKDLSLIYGQDHLREISRYGPFVDHSDIDDSDIVNHQKALQGKRGMETYGLEGQFSAQMDGYLRGALKNRAFSRWFGRENVMTEMSIKSRIDSIESQMTYNHFHNLTRPAIQ